MDIPREIRALYPFESHWTSIDGKQIHYLDEGAADAPPVVLLHGNPTWSFLYREIIPKISHACRAIAPDYVGMGLSEKVADERWFTLENHSRVINDFIESLGLKNIVLVLQDWGGPIGFQYALARQENVAALLIMNTWGWPEPSEFHASIMPWRMMHCPVIGAHLFLRRDILVERALYLSTGDNAKLRDGPVLDAYRLPYPTPISRIAILAFPRNIPLDSSHFNWEPMRRIEWGLATFEKPCRLLWGEKDIVFPPANAKRFQSILPNCAPPRLIAHGKHFVQEDAPHEIAEEILSLIGA